MLKPLLLLRGDFVECAGAFLAERNIEIFAVSRENRGYIFQRIYALVSVVKGSVDASKIVPLL
jgi:hypothetical protein